MKDRLKPIGHIRNPSDEVPRHHTLSQVEGEIVLEPRYVRGLQGLQPGDRIYVLFHFHESPDFTDEALIQHPKHHPELRGVFSICSPLRPNPIGLSVVEILAIRENVLRVRGLDMRNGTPVVDIKPVTGHDGSGVDAGVP